MRVSFGKFIPVKVFLNGDEIKNNNSKIMNPHIKQITLNMADCFSKDKNYPNTYLAEQQRRFFKSQVNDYSLPKKVAENKSDILPSTVKTVNCKGKRYLVTGDDVFLVQEIGHELGVQQKKNSDYVDKLLSPKAENMSPSQYEKTYKVIKEMYNKAPKAEREDVLEKYIKQNKIDKTLCISATYKKDEKLKRDQYQINFIDFK